MRTPAATGEQDALRKKLQKTKVVLGLPKRALRGLLFSRRKREAFMCARGAMRFQTGELGGLIVAAFSRMPDRSRRWVSDAP